MYIFIYPRRVGRPTTPSKRAGRSSVLKVTRHLTLLGAMAATLAAADVQAQTGWPAGTIKLVVAYPPGGSTDVIARLVQPCLQERLATPVSVENPAGGSRRARPAAVVHSALDGSSSLMGFY